MERKLVTIRQISAIDPIPNADAIEVLTVDGWKVVAKKDVHKVGEHVLYFEIDSFLPVKEEFEFLRKSSYKKLEDGTEGFRLKTVRLRGVCSQGLVIPLSTLFNISVINNECYIELPDSFIESLNYETRESNEGIQNL